MQPIRMKLISIVQFNNDAAQCDQSDPDLEHLQISLVGFSPETLEEEKLLISSSSVLVSMCI